MAKKFKTKRRIKKIKIFIYLIIILGAFFLYKFLISLTSINMNNKVLTSIINEMNSYSFNDTNNKSLVLKILSYPKKQINNPYLLIKTSYSYKSSKRESKKNVDTSIITDNNPLVYIYNTHQKEEYNMYYMDDYNVVPNVLLMSHIMQEKLNNIGINTIVEENNITEYLNNHHMKYNESYKVSRIYLEDILKKYSNLKLIIDLHRDANTHEKSIVDINGKICAKILFVVGKEYNTYTNNLQNVNKLNDLIISKYPDLSSGVLQKEGPKVNGIYNQDLNSNIILLELGSNSNNIDELMNTIDLLIPIIGEYINEK